MDLQEKHYLCESNQAFWNIYDEVRVYQCLVHGRGNSTKGCEKAVQDHERKPLNVNTLHFLFDFV